MQERTGGWDQPAKNNSLNSAKALFRDYKNLKDAGFKKEEAFRIILANKGSFNFTGVLNAAVKQIPSKK